MAKEINIHTLFTILTTKPTKVNQNEKERLLINDAFKAFKNWSKIFEEQIEKTYSDNEFENGLSDKPFESKYQMIPKKRLKTMLTEVELKNIIVNQWFQCLVELQTPRFADGRTRKNIRKHTWNNFIKGRYTNGKSREEFTRLFETIKTAN